MMLQASQQSVARAASQLPIRVAVLGGYELVRDALRALVARHGEFEALDGEAFGQALNHAGAAPDVLLLDVDGTHVDILTRLHETRGAFPASHVIVVIGHCDSDRAQELVLAGASGVITKDKSGGQLAHAIRKVHEGEVWLGRASMAHLIGELAWHVTEGDSADPERDRIASLTVRERDVVELVRTGLNNKAIAARLGISDNTVRHHLTSIFSKLDVPDRLALAVYAFRHRLGGQRLA